MLCHFPLQYQNGKELGMYSCWGNALWSVSLVLTETDAIWLGSKCSSNCFAGFHLMDFLRTLN